MNEKAAVFIVTPCSFYCFCIAHHIVHETFFLQDLTCPNKKEFLINLVYPLHTVSLADQPQTLLSLPTDYCILAQWFFHLLSLQSFCTQNHPLVCSLVVFFCLVALWFFFFLTEIVDWLHCSSLFCKDLCSCYKGITIN